MEVRRRLRDATRDDRVVQINVCLNVERYFGSIGGEVEGGIAARVEEKHAVQEWSEVDGVGC